MGGRGEGRARLIGGGGREGGGKRQRAKVRGEYVLKDGGRGRMSEAGSGGEGGKRERGCVLYVRADVGGQSLSTCWRMELGCRMSAREERKGGMSAR